MTAPIAQPTSGGMTPPGSCCPSGNCCCARMTAVIDLTDRRVRRQRTSDTVPARKPTVVKTTNTVNVRVDSTVVVRRVTRNEAADERSDRANVR